MWTAKAGPRPLSPWAAPSFPGGSWLGLDAGAGARQPLDWRAAWPTGVGAESTWASPERGEGAENQSLGWVAPGLVGQDPGCRVFLPRHFPLSHREQGSPRPTGDVWFHEGQGVSAGWEHTHVAPRWGVASTLGSPPPPPGPKETPKLESEGLGFHSSSTCSC